MTKLSVTIGLILIILGILTFIMTGAASATALIPSFFGIVFVGLGIWGQRDETIRKHAIHAALLLSILGVGGSIGGLLAMIKAIGGTMPVRPEAAIAQSIMALICVFFIAAAARSFFDARKSPQTNATFENGGNT